MSKFNRLIGMAAKALGDKAAPGGGASGGSPAGGTDWRGMVRSAADAITGDGRRPEQSPPAPHTSAPAPAGAGGLTPPTAGAARSSALSPADRHAIARYDYLVQTAEPAQLEQIHRDAFARLTPAQRAEVEARLSAELPPHERPRSNDPASLARAATRSEMLQPGSLRRVLGKVGRGAGVGAAVGVGAVAVGGVLAAVAGGAVLSTVAGSLLDQAAGLVDFDAVAEGLDPEALTGGAGEYVEGLGEQVSGFGEQFSNFELPSIGDFFGR